MHDGVRVLTGPAGCGKTNQLLRDYRQLLTHEPLGSVLWLCPTSRASGEVRRAILDGSLAGCLQPQCMTFDQFARRVLEASTLPVREIGTSIVAQMLRQLIAEASSRGELRYFAPIAHTPGFLQLVVGAIQEFKRLEIWPEELAAACRGRGLAKDDELCLIYSRYQQRLTAHHLYDAQGRFWQARALLREGQTRPFHPLRHVLVDGFTDFTRTEHEMLELLAARARSLSITLPLEDPSSTRAGDRDELFGKSAATLRELRVRHPRLQVVQLPRRLRGWPAMEHLEQFLFSNPRAAHPLADAAGIEIVPAAGAAQEIETLARSVKRLLVHGDAQEHRPARPEEILVVFRSLAEVCELVEEIFAQFGVPVALGTRPSLARSPLASALLGWLRLARDDWPFRQLLAMLGHNAFNPRWREWRPDVAAVAQRVVYALQLPSGSRALLAGAQRLASSASRRAADAQQALPFLTRLSGMLDGLPARATLAEWREALARLVAESGMLRANSKYIDVAEEEPPGSGYGTWDSATCDSATWETLLESLAAHEHLSDWLAEAPREYSLADWCEHLSAVLAGEPAAKSADETGRVRVLSAEQARNLSAPYVFVVGLSERAFPPAAREDCLLNEADTRELIQAGLPLIAAAHRPRLEMLLFYEVVTRATRRLVLSYPALDVRAQPLTPSPYLIEVEQAFGQGVVRRAPMAELSTVPASDHVLSPRELRVRAVSQARKGETRLLEQLCRHGSTRRMSENLLGAIEASRSRQSRAFGPFDGLLTADATRESLLARFGRQHCWSPSHLEQYAYCPFQFLLERVLGIEALEELEFGADYRRRGQMLHWLLSSLHRRLIEQGIEPRQQSPQEFQQLAESLLVELLSQGVHGGALGEGMSQIDARRVAQWLADYFGQQREYDALWSELEQPLRPAHFEVAFGPRRRGTASEDEIVDDVDPLSSDEPFELDLQGEVVRFSGRIDRIDLGRSDGKAVFNIVDYKSGKLSTRTNLTSVLEGRTLQLPLYALAAQKLLASQGAQPLRAAYWHLAAGGYRNGDAIRFELDPQGNLMLAAGDGSLPFDLRARVRALVDGIRGGQFPMFSADDECTNRCAYRTVCRVNQVRSLQKTWPSTEGGAP